MIAKKGDLCGIGVFVSTQRLSKLRPTKDRTKEVYRVRFILVRALANCYKPFL